MLRYLVYSFYVYTKKKVGSNMARQARTTSELNTYLVVLRTQDIEVDDVGKKMLLDALSYYIRKTEGALYAYHFGEDCFRFVLRSSQMSELMKSTCIRFVYSYNKYKGRRGEIFKDRFTSYGAHTKEEVAIMIATLHYLKPTTVFCSKQEYSSNIYLQDKFGKNYLEMTPQKEEHLYALAQSQEVLDFMRKVGKKYSDEELKILVDQMLEGEQVELPKTSVEKKKSIIKKLGLSYGASVRQIVKITGLPFRFVYETVKKVMSR